MKRLISFLLAAVTLVTVFTVSSGAYVYRIYRHGNYSYTFKGKDIQIVGYFGKESTVKIPSTLLGRKVVALSDDRPDKRGSWEDFNEVVDWNGDFQFGFWLNKYVETIIVPNSVKYISSSFFAECGKLKSVKLPSGLKTVSYGLFRNCKKLKNVSIPETVTKIEEEAFMNCGIKTFYIGSNVKKIKPDAFMNSKITKFKVDKANKYFSSAKGVLYNKKKTKLYYYPSARKQKNYRVRKTVKRIEESAFYNHKYLKKITLDKKLKYIGKYAFYKCKKLETVNFNRSLKTIDKHAFESCYKLVKVNLKNKVTEIRAEAFSDCHKLKQVSLSENLKYIGKESFAHCPKLSSVDLKSKKKLTVDKYAFYECESLKRVDVPENTVKIEKKAFGIVEEYDKAMYDWEDVVLRGFILGVKYNSPAYRYARKYKMYYVYI